MVDFVFRQGPREFSTADIARYFEDWKRARTPPGAERCRLWMDTNKHISCSTPMSRVQWF